MIVLCACAQVHDSCVFSIRVLKLRFIFITLTFIAHYNLARTMTNKNG